MKRSTFLRQMAAAALTAGMARPLLAAAESYPSRPIRLVVPYSPGGLPDTVARLLALRLQGALGQPVVVENKPGASGAIAASAIAQAPADGYTLLVTDGPMLSITPLLTRKPSYDPAKDFVPVSLIGTAPLFLAVNAKVNARTLDELIALAKARPGSLNYGSSGTGSIHHLTAEAMKASLGIALTHIPFRGSANSVPAMIGGQVDMVFSSPPSLMGFVKAGQARLIAINAPHRSALAPEVPALAEKSPGFDFAFTVAVLAKAGTPGEAIDRIQAEIARIVRQPEVAEQLQTAGVDPAGGTPKELAQALRAESLRVAAAARQARLQPE